MGCWTHIADIHHGGSPSSVHVRETQLGCAINNCAVTCTAGAIPAANQAVASTRLHVEAGHGLRGMLRGRCNACMLWVGCMLLRRYRCCSRYICRLLWLPKETNKLRIEGCNVREQLGLASLCRVV